MKLKTKFILAFLAISIIPILLVTFILSNTSINISDKKAGELLNQASSDKVEFIDEYVDSVKKQVDLTLGNLNIANSNIDYAKIELQNIAKSNEDIGCVYIGYPGNNTLAYPDNIPEGYDQATRDWYKNAVEKKGEYAISEPYVDAITGKPVITVSKSFNLSSGETAVAAIDILLETIYNVISKNKFGEAGEVILSSSQGKILVHSSREYVNKNLDDITKHKQDISNTKSGLVNSNNTVGEKALISYDTSEVTGWHVICSLPEKEYAEDVKKAITTITILSIMLIAGIIAYSLFFTGKIISIINNINNQIKTFENGDLNCLVNIKRKDELGSIQESLNGLIKTFKNIITNMKNASNGVKDASNSLMGFSHESEKANSNISDSIEEMAIMSEGNYSSVEEVNASVEETLGGYREMAENIENVKEDSVKAVKVANTGNEYLDEAINSMDEIEAATEDMGKIIESMEEYSTKIDFILGTITSISEQTNLLALNAAIEAARAGESGRGFAVVADEVRNLAEESSKSAGEIASIIQNIKIGIGDTVKGIERKRVLVKDGKVKTADVKVNLNEIIKSIERVDEYLERINTKTKDQTRSMEEIATAIESVSSSVEQSVSFTEKIKLARDTQSNILEQMNGSVNSLNNMASVLEDDVKSFEIEE